MTELDKKIIEIIEPCMDKTLSEGCYFIINSESYGGPGNGGGDIFDDILILGRVLTEDKYLGIAQASKDMFLYPDKKGDIDLKMFIHFEENEIDDIERGIEKIIGHYDITAVLKYIDNFKNPFTGKGPSVIFNSGKISIGVGDGLYTKWHMAEKPLHLYSEQEKKDLLTLLKQLKGQD